MICRSNILLFHSVRFALPDNSPGQAFASSRKWKITLFRSAMRSKFRVKASKTSLKLILWVIQSRADLVLSLHFNQLYCFPIKKATLCLPNDIRKTPKRMAGTCDCSILKELEGWFDSQTNIVSKFIPFSILFGICWFGTWKHNSQST
jgi:hypothetical protein